MSNLRERIKKLRTAEATAEAAQVKEKPAEAAPRAPKREEPEAQYTVQRQKSSLGRQQYQELKRQTHRKLLDALDLTILSELKDEEVNAQIRSVVQQLLDQSGVTFNKRERSQFVQEIVDEVMGFGPLEPLLQDASISDILINGAKQVYVEQHGKLLLTNVEFKDSKHLRHVMDRIVSTVGRHIDESSP
ncbi:MAG: CpaF family protein, partial [Planctomycetota bacterium]